MTCLSSGTCRSSLLVSWPPVKEHSAFGNPCSGIAGEGKLIAVAERTPVLISIEPDTARELRDTILSGLFSYNDQIVGPMHNSTIIIAARSDDDKVIGGLIVNFQPGWKWMHLQWMWIAESHRRTGIGRRLVDTAEREGRKRACLHVAVDTFQAREFYEKLGYSVYGVMEDYPAGHRKFHMRKTLSDERAAGAPDVPPRV